MTWQKLKDVFKVAGRIVNVEIQTDGEGRSRGCAVVQFEEPTEAITAICIFLIMCHCVCVCGGKVVGVLSSSGVELCPLCLSLTTGQLSSTDKCWPIGQ